MAEPQRVLLLHGLWMGPWVLQPLSRRLQAAGFEVERLGYASVRADPEACMDVLAERLRRRPAQHLVAHSLGGLIALQMLRREPELGVQRVVCLGSPLCGSRAATGLSRWGWGQQLLGRSADLLRNGVPAWNGTAQIGLIAGTMGMGAGRLLANLKAPHDGTVEVEETRLQGLADHVCLAVSHTGLLASMDVAKQTTSFLQDGHFVR
jgi:pimeloyl-ACP methyl ester carboxylesterase